MEENKQTNTTTTEVNQPNTEAPKSYTQEEVDKLIQAEADRRVNQALTKKEREMAKKLTEAERLGKMSEEEKFKYQLEQKEAELAAKEREFTLRDNKIAAMKVLSEREIAADLVEFIVHEDADIMMANINQLDKFIKASVAAQVKARLGGAAPKTGLNNNAELTKEQFSKMTYAQRVELSQNNPELYKKLSGR